MTVSRLFEMTKIRTSVIVTVTFLLLPLLDLWLSRLLILHCNMNLIY